MRCGAELMVSVIGRTRRLAMARRWNDEATAC